MTQTLVDTHVYLDRWPFRRMPGDEPAELAAKLRAKRVEKAWVASFDGVFHRDLGAANERLARVSRTVAPDLLIPFGAVNPTLPDWEEDLRRIVEVHHMPGVRLYPNYHGYTLDSTECSRLLDAAVERGLFVQLVVSLEDERTQHRLVRVPPVAIEALVAQVASRPRLRLQLLNAFRGPSPAVIDKLVQSGQVFVDIANLENVGGLARLAERLPSDRILFGSHFPLFYWEAAWLKLRESPLTDEQRRLISTAQRLLEQKS
ncbi:MAG: amidohydrolase family protein [Pirellulales bacterium]